MLKAWSVVPVPPKERQEPLDVELAALQRNVSLGNWPAVQDYLDKLPYDEAKAGYRQMLASLQSAVTSVSVNG